ncbi:alpha/beta hydrolase family protein [Rhizomonospora bruguierae]|uniref:alpha/beta hydrolase family protein n=1 Tax=Rhizomonospora bruguierae TaxID=1581705 RepID=UPI001BCE137D|nr:prolyl oligopeptidase family serine peptidase [Micromonospora sp. NBRC 107566]
MSLATRRAAPRAAAGLAAIAMLMVPAVNWRMPAASASPANVSTTAVTVHSEPLDLPGSVLAPTAPAGRRPGLVIVYDSGPRRRATYEAEARLLAEAGIVTLIYDKRTSGYSMTNRSFGALADDALAAVELLRARPDVDPARVGLLGRSEGGWVAPLAASRSPHVAFVITVGASGLPPARTQAWSNVTHLDHAGVSESLWTPLGVNPTRVLVAAGMFGAANYDPAPALERTRQPLLAVFGANDRSTAPGETVRLFATALERRGNQHYTIRVLPDADHRLHRSRDGFTQSDQLAPGYVDLITSWITGPGQAPPAPVVDPAPTQGIDSSPLSPLAWYESIPMHLGALEWSRNADRRAHRFRYFPALGRVLGTPAALSPVVLVSHAPEPRTPARAHGHHGQRNDVPSVLS